MEGSWVRFLTLAKGYKEYRASFYLWTLSCLIWCLELSQPNCSQPERMEHTHWQKGTASRDLVKWIQSLDGMPLQPSCYRRELISTLFKPLWGSVFLISKASVSVWVPSCQKHSSLEGLNKMCERMSWSEAGLESGNTIQVTSADSSNGHPTTPAATGGRQHSPQW